MARYSNPIIQYSDGNGVPLPGATLDFFEPGTTTRKNTFSDSGLTTANPNPVVADSAGVMPDIWLDGTYAVVLKNAGGVVQPEGTKDPIGETTEGQWEAWLNDNTYNIPDLVKGSDNKFYRSLTDANQGNDPTSSASDWENIEFERIYNSTVTYDLGDRSIGSDGMEYFSLVASNLNNNPTASDNWRASDQTRSADAAGTADELTATFLPALPSPVIDKFQVVVRALLANTTTTPTFNGDTITKNGNEALAAGDIFGPGHILIMDYNLANTNWELLNPSKSAFSGSLLHIREEQPNGTNAGGTTASAYVTRSLNTVKTNEIPGASLSAPSINLPAGDYYIEASAPCYEGDLHKIKLFNFTLTSDIIFGTSESSFVTSDTTSRSFISGRFTLSAAESVRILHFASTTRNALGLGIASASGDVEVYCDVKIWRL